MPNILVKITCTRPNWAVVDETDVNDGDVIPLPVGDHTLFWAIVGAPGDSFKAVLTDGARVVCNVDWAIPAGSSGYTGDLKQFVV